MCDLKRCRLVDISFASLTVVVFGIHKYVSHFTFLKLGHLCDIALHSIESLLSCPIRTTRFIDPILSGINSPYNQPHGCRPLGLLIFSSFLFDELVFITPEFVFPFRHAKNSINSNLSTLP